MFVLITTFYLRHYLLSNNIVFVTLCPCDCYIHFLFKVNACVVLCSCILSVFSLRQAGPSQSISGFNDKLTSYLENIVVKEFEERNRTFFMKSSAILFELKYNFWIFQVLWINHAYLSNGLCFQVFLELFIIFLWSIVSSEKKVDSISKYSFIMKRSRTCLTHGPQ